MKILICTNGKRHSEDAIHFTCSLLGVFNPEVTLLFVGLRAVAESFSEREMNILKKYNISGRWQIIEGRDKIVETIVRESKIGGYDLLVMGSRGVPSMIPGVSSFVLGDIPRKVIPLIGTSMLIVTENPEHIDKVLIGVDGSEASHAAVEYWGMIAREHKNGKRSWHSPKVNLLTVLQELYSYFSNELRPLAENQLAVLERASNEHTNFAYRSKIALFDKYGVVSTIRLREGDVAEELLKESDRDYDLLVLGRSAHKEVTFGRHVKEVVQQAKIPVLVIRSDLVKKLLP